MIIAKFCGCNTATAYGLTQWDYGQELAIEYAAHELSDTTEVNFYQGKLSSTAYLKNGHVMIPDIMLQNADDIVAYVYVRNEGSGETLLSIKLPIRARPRPENYVLPEYQDYKRLLPAGGEPGQTLIKKTDDNFDIGWGDSAGVEAMTDEDIDAIFA